MRILHLISDHQVIERTLGVYEKAFPGCNEILVFNNSDKFKRLKQDYTGKIVNWRNLNYVGQNYDFKEITHVISHYMSMDKIEFIKFIPKNIHVCWEIYGQDLYGQFLVPLGYQMYYTKPVNYEKHSFIKKYFKNLYKILLIVLKGAKYQFDFQKKAQFEYISGRINSIQYCCGYDAKFVENFAGRSIPSYEIFNYSLDEVLGELKEHDFFDGSDFLIGNSASITNNHLYTLNFLKEIGINKESKLIIPLSYGGTKKYIEKVSSEYIKQFPNQVVFLRDYIPLNEYNKMFLNFKSVILVAWRQESQGTAILAFYLGIKVFMSERSPLYKWFLDCGFIVYNIENINGNEFNEPLTKEEKEHNRLLVLQRYNNERILEVLKQNII